MKMLSASLVIVPTIEKKMSSDLTRSDGCAWSTRSEISFIKKLGSDMTYIPRIDFLQGYLKSTKKRVRWGDIDKAEVLAQLKIEIQLCG
jgi:hypothetical protein